MANQEYIGQIAITNSTKDLSVNNGTAYAVALTAGNYFAQGYSGESTAQLIEHLQVQIRAAHAAFDTGGANECTVSRSASTGLITIAFAAGGGNVSVTWTDADLGTLLGFTVGNLSGAYTYTASVTPKGVWRPSRPLSELPGDETSWWGKRSTSRVTISLDGSTYGVEGDLLYDGVFKYESLADSETIDTAARTWTTFESFWETVVHKVMPIRILPDRTSYTSTTYFTGIMVQADAETDGKSITVGHLEEYKNKTVTNYLGLWDVAFKLAKYVVAS